MLKTFLLKAFETAISKALSFDPESYTKLKALDNKRIQLELTNTDITVVLVFTQHGVQLMDISSTAPDIILRGSPAAFMKLHAQATLNLYQSDVKIIGDMGLADEIRKVFQQLDLDWEGGLAEYTGDTVAHYLAKLARQSLAFTRQTRNNLCIDTKDYLQEEVHLLPAREEMTHFITEVTELRDAVERLAARINLLS